METPLVLIAATLLVIAAQTTYLVVLARQKKPSQKTTSQPIFVDTSVLIDGRIISVAASGFITSTLYIPRSVIGELQYLADNGDTEKRTRARHGLDVVKELQSLKTVTASVFQDGETAEEGVDNRLLKLAKEHHGAVCTIDYNLNKVAQVEGITVLNVNELAKSLRMAYLPGERMMIDLTQRGNDAHQAIGHLTDGTMVVVEHASAYVGKKLEIEFIRGLQTAAGKMMFARLVEPPKKPQTQPVPAKQTKGRKPLSATKEKVQAVAQKPAKKQQLTPRQQSQQSQQAQKPQQPSRPKQQRRKPMTNEERLVELANNQPS